MSKNCIIYFASQHADLLPPLVRRLKTSHGLDTILVCRDMRELPANDTSKFDYGLFKQILCYDSILEATHVIDSNESLKIADRCARIEESLGASPLDIMRTDRHVGIGFVSGARFLRSSYGGRVNYLGSLDIVIRLCEFFGNLIDEARPVFVITTYSPLAGASLFAVAEGKGVPARWPITAKVGKKMFWTYDRSLVPPQICKTFRRLTSELNTKAPVQLGTPYGAAQVNSAIPTQTSYASLAQALVRVLRRGVILKLQGRYQSYGNYYVGAQVRHIISKWLWRRRAVSLAPVAPNLPDSLPFVFYPLMIEPESSLMCEVQEADNQLTVIDWLCKAVPAGWYVLIKEHPGRTSARPASFWERIRSYPNALVATPFETAEAFINRSRAVATINGSIGIQAAVGGTPVIAFHRNYLGNVMDHVVFAGNYEETRQALRTIAKEDGAEAKERRIRNGAAFHAALEECSFSIEHEGLLLGIATGTPVPQSDIDALVESLLDETSVEGMAQVSR